MIAGARIGILGGTLDPIHLGHLDTAAAARAALDLDRILIVPSHVPPHRTPPVASAYHRFAMAALAVNGVPELAVSDEELCAPGPSFTADTLTRLHARGLEPSQIFFITGADAFAEIATWRRYPEVLDLAQFVVISRPGFAATALPEQMPALAARMTTGSRGSAAAADASIFLVDAATRDISSTHIRARLARGETASRLVPDLVEAHIVQHGLYAGSPRHGSTRTTANHLHGQD
jgi:nicotinate-nucleotide adenylyltransferase